MGGAHEEDETMLRPEFKISVVAELENASSVVWLLLVFRMAFDTTLAYDLGPSSK